MWALVAVGVIALGGATAGAYLGLRGHLGPGATGGMAPPPRAFAASAYDDATHQLVLFGGTDTTGDALGDTWTWNGSAWAEQHPSASPPARTNAAMTYDPKTHDLVLVGGRSTTNQGGTVCSGSGSATGSAGSVIPPAATSTAGQAPIPCAASAPTDFTDTWLWTGSAWQQTNATAPPGMIGPLPVIGTDRASGQVLLLTPQEQHPADPCVLPAPTPPAPGSGSVSGSPPSAGCNVVVPTSTVRTSIWSGSSWTPLSAEMPMGADAPVLTLSAALVEDPATGHLAYFSNRATIACGPLPAQPQSVPATPCPLAPGSASSSSSVTSNAPPTSASAQLPLVTGTAQPAPAMVPCCYGSESVWNGGAWSAPVSFSKGPSTDPSAIAGDRARGTVVAYTPGGTWTWSGGRWTEMHTGDTPGAVSGTTMAYDPDSSRVLLFGGMALGVPATPPGSGSSGAISSTSAPVSNALWAWDGTNWSQLSGSPPPNPSSASTPPVAPSAPRATILPAPASPSPGVSPPPTLRPCIAAPGTPADPGGTATPCGTPLPAVVPG